MLAMLAKLQRGLSYLSKVTTSFGDTVCTHSVILLAFCDFYIDLYSSNDIHAFLDTCDLPKLRKLDREMLNTPLTRDELLEALALSPSGKSPGADGIPVEVYKRYADHRIPRLKIIFNDAMER